MEETETEQKRFDWIFSSPRNKNFFHFLSRVGDVLFRQKAQWALGKDFYLSN
jgi:hypothetical protein